MTTALVLAGNSFVGSQLCRELGRAGAETAATSFPEHVPDMAHCDLTDPRQAEEVVAATRPDWVFQCAGATTTNDPRLLYRLHVEGTLHVLSALKRHAPTAVAVLFGSAAEYGTPPPEALPAREETSAIPTSFFGASKLAQTEAARVAAAEWDLSVLVVRPFNILGPGLPAHYFAAALANRLREALANGEAADIPVVNAEATRDFVDVRDVAEAVLGLVTRAKPASGTLEVYNIASGCETPLLAVAQRLCALAGGFRPVNAGSGQSRSGVTRSRGDASKLRARTGWAPRVSWERSIEDMWQARQSQSEARPR
jgi:GDP-4-dehydro-6-deoxy-D-mannose reductase